MPLPTIVTPSYELTLPSNGKKVKYRPFLVKEEKILILAIESGNTQDITRAIKDVLKNCIQTRGIKVDQLPTFDIEYLFLNIRAKSVGESVELIVICPDDGVTEVPTTVYIDEIQVYTYEKELIEILKNGDFTIRFLGNDYLDRDFTGSHLNIPIHYISRDHGWSTTKFKNEINKSFQSKKD